MERLTESALGCFKFMLKDFKSEVGDFGRYDAFFAYCQAVSKLGEYEDTGLTPEEVAELAKAKED